VTRNSTLALPALLLSLAIFLTPGCPAVDDDDVAGDDDDASGCGDGDPAVTEISPDELAEMLESGDDFLLINTHVPHAGEIPGTDVHIPYTNVDGLVEYLGDDLSVVAVVYCYTGPMSASAANKLVDRGYCNILDMPGGMSAWAGDGYDLDP
jgi:rhodanese-related sulfurtransferase